MKQIFNPFELFITESIIILILFSSFTFGQTENWIVFNTMNSPLEDNIVHIAKHDKSDNIWIGTNYGLMKYDGYFWNLYNTGNSDLPSNTVRNLVMDKHSNFWFVVNPSNYPYFLKFDGNEWVKKDTNSATKTKRKQRAKNKRDQANLKIKARDLSGSNWDKVS